MELSVRALVQHQDIVCQAVGRASNPIIVLRGQNKNTKFSHANKGKWALAHVTGISRIIRDRDFKDTQV